MSSEITVALISLVGTALGTLGGILAANRLTNYRIEQLEKKVQAHNNIVERTYKLEGQVTECIHEIQDLKKFHQPKP